MENIRKSTIGWLMGWMAVLCLCVCAQAAAENEWADQRTQPVKERLCVIEDILGHTYKMVEFKETPPRRESTWTEEFPYQYIAFYPYNTYSSLGTNVEFTSPAELNVQLRPNPKQKREYTLSSDGVLQLIDTDLVRFSYRCVAVVTSHDKYVKGDIIVNGYSKKGKSQIYRLYRRWY